MAAPSSTATSGRPAWILEPLPLPTAESATVAPSNPHLYLPPPPARLALHTRLVPRAASQSDANGSSGARAPRILVVGDIHGCMDELLELISAAGLDLSAGDTVVATGDLVSKGPKSAEVVRWFVSNGQYSVLGNHDEFLLKNALLRGRLDGRHYDSDADILLWNADRVAAAQAADQDGETYALTYYARMNGFDYRARTECPHYGIVGELSDEELRWVAALPLSIDLSAAFPPAATASAAAAGAPASAPTCAWTVVHAGLVPGVPLAAQHPAHMMQMRNFEEARSEVSDATKIGSAWSLARVAPPSASGSASDNGTSGQQPTGILFGHDAGRGFQFPQASRLGLDTGACNGRFLTGLLLPESRLISVPSHAMYSRPKSDVTRPPPLPSGIPLADVPCVEPAKAHAEATSKSS